MSRATSKKESPPTQQADTWHRGSAQLRAILNTTVDGIVTINEHGIIDGFNPAAEQLFGYTAAEVMGRDVSVLMPEPERSAHAGYLRRYLETGEKNVIGRGREVVGQNKSGECFPMDLAVSEVREGEHRFFVGIIRDIAERKRVEFALENERNFVSAVLETVGALIVVLDRKGRIVRFNRACEQTTRYTQEEVVGKAFWDLFLEEQEVAAVKRVFSELQAGQALNHYENSWIAKDGSKHLIAWSNTILTDQNGEVAHVIGTGIDVTDRKKAEEAIVSVSEAERKAIGQELHDALGQQLTGISLLTKGLERKLQSKYPAGATDAAQVSSLTSAAVEDAKRLAHGLYPSALEELGLTTSLEELVKTQSRLFHVTCEYEGDPNPPRFDKPSALHLYRIAQEAINNAIRHGRAETITVNLRRRDGFIALTIQDDGSGLPEQLPPDAGMGLAIMNYRTNSIGGTFEIARRPEGGTMVSCVLPPPKGSTPEDNPDAT